MRRVLPVALAVVGVLLIVAGGVVKWVVAPALVKVPLDVDRTTIATGVSQVFVLSRQSVDTVDVTATRSVRADKDASTGSVVVFDESLCLHGPGPTTTDQHGCAPATDPAFIQKTTDRTAVGRKSGLAVRDDGRFGTNVDGDKSIAHVGIGYTFPIDTEKKTYPFFDTVVGQAFPMHYVGTTKLHGLTLYEFRQEVPASDIKINGVLPGKYTNTRVVWVEPTTGVIVKGSEQIVQRFASGNGVAFDGTLIFTDATVASQADYARGQLRQVHLIRWWLPLGAVALGIILILVALALVPRGRRSARPRHTDLAPAAAT